MQIKMMSEKFRTILLTPLFEKEQKIMLLLILVNFYEALSLSIYNNMFPKLKKMMYLKLFSHQNMTHWEK